MVWVIMVMICLLSSVWMALKANIQKVAFVFPVIDLALLKLQLVAFLVYLPVRWCCTALKLLAKIRFHIRVEYPFFNGISLSVMVLLVHKCFWFGKPVSWIINLQIVFTFLLLLKRNWFNQLYFILLGLLQHLTILLNMQSSSLIPLCCFCHFLCAQMVAWILW